MSVTAVSPVSLLNATSLINKEQPQTQSYPKEDTEKAKAQISSDVSSSGSTAVAVQAFTAFQPDVQPIAILGPPAMGRRHCRSARERISVAPRRNGPGVWWMCTLRLGFGSEDMQR